MSGDTPVPVPERGLVVVIGKPGSGKSTFINRFLGTDIARTAVGGAASTGFQDCRLAGSSFTLLDTPGLDREGWELVTKRMRDANTSEWPEEHVHAVVYILNLMTGRIENGELSIMESVLAWRVPLVLVCTKSFGRAREMEFMSTVRTEVERMRERLALAADLPVLPVEGTRVNSVAVETEWGGSVPVFGYCTSPKMRGAADLVAEAVAAGQAEAVRRVRLRADLGELKKRCDAIVAREVRELKMDAMIPIPFADLSFVWGRRGPMVKRLCDVFGVQESAALAERLAAKFRESWYWRRLGLASLAKLIPILGTFGGAAWQMSVTEQDAKSLGDAVYQTLEAVVFGRGALPITAADVERYLDDGGYGSPEPA